jgi:hypothetical protein
MLRINEVSTALGICLSLSKNNHNTEEAALYSFQIMR